MPTANFTRIPKARYEAEIAAAEARGRAAAIANAPIAPTAPLTITPAAAVSPVIESVRVSQIRALPLAANYPTVIESAVASGLTVGEAANRVLAAHAARGAGGASTNMGTATGAAQFVADEMRQYMSDNRVDETAAREALEQMWVESAPARRASTYAAKLRAHVDTAARSGRKLNLAEADAELRALGE